MFLYFALIVDAAYRAVFRHEALDLLALVIVTGTANVVYQTRHHTWARSQTKVAVLFGLLGAVLAGSSR